MVFPILPANTLSGAYDIANSCRFNAADDPLLTYTPSGTSSDANKRKYTISIWFKRSDFVREQGIFNWGKHTNSDDMTMFWQADAATEEYFRIYDTGNDFGGSGDNWKRQLNRRHRDPSAWQHIVVRVDTTDGTAGDRQKVYIDGVQETSFSSTVDATLNYAGYCGSADTIDIGCNVRNTDRHFGGYLAEIAYIDGTAYTADSFGEMDEDSGIWKPKAISGLTFGTNGFYLEFKQSGTGTDSSGIGADTSGNDNHFAVSNLTATDQTTDTPTNNFATFNPLMGGRGSTLSEGNLKVSGESDNNYDVATFGSDMKWYYEWKVDDNYDGAGGGIRLGALHEDELVTNDNFSNFANATAKFYTNSNDGKTQDGAGANVTTGLTRATTNDIIMCACDGAGAKIWWGINGTWLDYGSGTGDPAAGSNAATWTTAMKAGIWFPTAAYSGTAAGGQLNLGNPSFAISSGNADDNGYGNFEYDVPAGFYALCTKNLAEYG